MGQAFGRLTAISREHKASNGAYYWRWKCLCGGEAIAVPASVRAGLTQSCGCLQREQAVKFHMKKRGQMFARPEEWSAEDLLEIFSEK